MLLALPQMGRRYIISSFWFPDSRVSIYLLTHEEYSSDTCIFCANSLEIANEDEKEQQIEHQQAHQDKSLVEGSQLRQLPCTHLFHKPCIDIWLSSCNASCPLCRQTFYYLKRPQPFLPLNTSNYHRATRRSRIAETRDNRSRNQPHHHGLSFNSLKDWWKRSFLDGNLNTASPPIAVATNWIRETAA